MCKIFDKIIEIYLMRHFFITIMFFSDLSVDRRKQLLLQGRSEQFHHRFRRRKIRDLVGRRPEPGADPRLLHLRQPAALLHRGLHTQQVGVLGLRDVMMQVIVEESK